MQKVINDFQIGKYRVLELDKSTSGLKYFNVKIGGKEFKTTPIYDAKDNFIAIESTQTFVGKTIEFV